MITKIKFIMIIIIIIIHKANNNNKAHSLLYIFIIKLNIHTQVQRD
jgi:hypothetical protein